ncbi:AraC family transcriptional regulator N-terminal domain-containing protein [Streptomyces canarius]
MRTRGNLAQGTMRTVLKGEPHEYGAGEYLVAPLDLPSTSQVVQADPEARDFTSGASLRSCSTLSYDWYGPPA